MKVILECEVDETIWGAEDFADIFNKDGEFTEEEVDEELIEFFKEDLLGLLENVKWKIER